MVLRLKILCSLWFVGNSSSINLKKDLPMLVLTVLLYGGLYHIVFLFLCLVALLSCVAGSGENSSVCWYPLFSGGSW